MSLNILPLSIFIELLIKRFLIQNNEYKVNTNIKCLREFLGQKRKSG